MLFGSHEGADGEGAIVSEQLWCSLSCMRAVSAMFSRMRRVMDLRRMRVIVALFESHESADGKATIVSEH